MLDRDDEIMEDNELLVLAFEKYLEEKGYSKKTIRLYTGHAHAYINYIIDGTDEFSTYKQLSAIDGVRHISWYLQRLEYKFLMSEYTIKENARGIKSFYKWMHSTHQITDEEYEIVKRQTRHGVRTCNK